MTRDKSVEFLSYQIWYQTARKSIISLQIIALGFIEHGGVFMPASISPSSPQALEHFVDAGTAGKFLKLHPVTVQRLARQGILPGHSVTKGARKQWRFLLTELRDWLCEKGTALDAQL